MSVAHLYFADMNTTFLTSEQRSLPHPENEVDYARSIVLELIRGPQKGLVRTIPGTTQLRALYISSEGICYVDLSRAAEKDHPGGCNSELLTVYSLVNSLILNIPEIRRVKLLIGGQDTPTLAGHIDLKPSLAADMLLIR